ncbi:hypothetical protein BKA63DRAFT_590183 [Paraphoma chrysanthemicola]|nr:hypothetical protein BKA63DRAFT_590183 [Paraphoma chrysanthemicola]
MPPTKSKSNIGRSRNQSLSQTNERPAAGTKGTTLIIPEAEKRRHDDDEEIHPGNFPWKELVPGWQDMDVNTKNPAIGKVFKNTHHVPGAGTKKKKDFEKFTFALCLEWVWDEEKGKWRRCSNQFCVNSQQCTKHLRTWHKDGPNQIWKHMKEGRVGNWGMLKNRHLEDKKPSAPAAALSYHQGMDKLTEEVEIRVKKGEDRTTVWFELTEKREEEERIAQKVKKLAARGNSTTASDVLEKNSTPSITRKGKSRKTSANSDVSLPQLDAKLNRNPNQRGKKAMKAGVTKGLFSIPTNLAPITEE